MTARKPIVLGTDGAHQQLQDGDALLIGNATLDPSALTASHTLSLPDKSGTLATTDDISGAAGAANFDSIVVTSAGDIAVSAGGCVITTGN